MHRLPPPSPFVSAARKLLESEGKAAHGATEIAVVTVQTCEKISRHIGRLVGNDGARALFDRSLTVVRGTFPWLDGQGGSTNDSMAGLRESLAKQAPGVALDASALVVGTLIELIARLIGDALAVGLMHELWPDAFPATVNQEKS